MKKNKITIILICSISLIVILLTCNISNIVDFTFMQIIRRLEEPIDLKSFTINNKYFGISSNGKNADSTTKGINEAIDYASRNNIEYIRFEKGIYAIWGITTTNMEEAGIILKSNLHIDFNNSIIKQEVNDSIAYISVSIQDCNNVEISNGVIVGDRKEHEFVEDSTSQWGHGVCIKDSNNITLNNLEIYDAIGDGIYITGNYINDKNSTNNINIKNCNIHDNRRQGISVISGNNIQIYNNEIYNIGGTPPHTGIDLESNGRWQRISNIAIENNKMYNLKSNRAISINAYVDNVNISNNEIHGGIYGQYIEDYVSITGNIMMDGSIFIEYKEQNFINNLMIKENELNNITITIEGSKQAEIDNNVIKGNKNIQFFSSNCIITNNHIESNENKQIMLRIREDDINNNKYIVKSYNNTLNDANIEVTVEDENRFTIINN